jgi:leucyl aminopeptidase
VAEGHVGDAAGAEEGRSAAHRSVDELVDEFADIANIATKGEGGGAIIGATFLAKFTRKMKWAHLDIAGTAWMGKRGTGRPVPLLTQYLLNYAGKGKDE